MTELAKVGFNVIGIDSSKAATSFANDNGLTVACGDFPDPRVQGPFDGVVLSHVLEHIAEPTQFLAHVASVVPTGKVFFTQTDHQGLMRKRLGTRWYWVPDQHFWHFTPFGLTTLLKSCGWGRSVVKKSSLIHHPRSRCALLTRFYPWFGDQFHLVSSPAAVAQEAASVRC